jgi:hypothetical protein
MDAKGIGTGLLAIGGAAAFTLVLAIADRACAQQESETTRHLGVASCAGNNCHGAVERLKTSSVPQNEYLTWSKSDKHRLAYSKLQEARGVRIARNLGLPDAISAAICLNCHADNVPKDRRGPQFQLSDGVGCEACHGGASTWLGVHISGTGHAANLAAGLYPTEQALPRAKKCFSCHFGDPADPDRFTTHRIMGAGHPRMGFEVDTYTAAEPAHFTVDRGYIQRKGPVSDVKIWAVGQASNLVKRMDALMDPHNAPKGIQPELVLFDCDACHHPTTKIRWRPRRSTGLGPGAIRLNDANAVMLRVIAGRVSPAAAKTLSEQITALHRATGENWSAVVAAAKDLRQTADGLVHLLSTHEFGADDLKALAQGLIAAGVAGDDTDFASAEQATMALGSIAAGMKMSGTVGGAQLKTMNDALDHLMKTVDDETNYRPEAFVAALEAFRKTMPQ